MKILDLFAGSCSVANVAKAKGWETFTSDIEPFPDIDYQVDILDFDVDRVPFIPDVIWASPPCQFFSVGSIGIHWNKDHTPKTMNAIKGMMWVQATKEIIATLTLRSMVENGKRPFFFIENPRGKLRKLGLLPDKFLRTVCYCQYGDFRMKPTDIWTNCTTWTPREMCFNGNTDCHHAPAPRGSKTGTQGMKNAYEKSKIPEELVKEILDASISGM